MNTKKTENCKVYCLAIQKGGVAKTTSSVAMSAALAELGYKVLLIDNDPQANSTRAVGRFGKTGTQYSITNIMEDLIEKNNLFLFLIPFLFILISCTVLGLGLLDNPAFPDQPWHPVLEEITDTDDDKNNEIPQIQVAGFSSWHIPAGKTQSIPVSLKNPEGNPCYFSFDIYLKDSKDVLYSSKMVKPGDEIKRININKALSAGKYTAVVHINTNELETGSKMNDASFEVKLTVS